MCLRSWHETMVGGDQGNEFPSRRPTFVFVANVATTRDGFSAYVRSRMRRPVPGLADWESWCNLVEQYVLSRQQTERFASAVNISPGHVAPILALELGREASRQSFRMGSTDEIRWFERDARPSTMAVPPKIDETENPELQEYGSSRKRRKMRSVKKQDLTEMFSGF